MSMINRRTGKYVQMELERQLAKARDAYERTMLLELAKARQKYVVPFCERTGLCFSTGMGSWSFHGSDNGTMLNYQDDSKLPKRLYQVLMAETLFQVSAGAMMKSYTPTTYGGRP